MASLALLGGAVFSLRAGRAGKASSHGREPAAARANAQAPVVTIEASEGSRRSDVALVRPRPKAQPEPSDDGKTPLQPHPADPARAALIPPWAAFEEVESALAQRDFERARTELELRQRQDPNPADWRDFYVGLDIMRACLEEPGPVSRARAKNFIDEYRASPLRRHVRRSCAAAEPAASLDE